MTDDVLKRLEQLGKRRDKINVQRAEIIAEMRAAMREAYAAGVMPTAIARSAGVSREAVRLALQD